MFVDASAWTAMLLEELEAEAFRVKLAGASVVLTSAVSGWETVRAVARETGQDQARAAMRLDELQATFEALLIPSARSSRLSPSKPMPGSARASIQPS